jgi:hypothetical protein
MDEHSKLIQSYVDKKLESLERAVKGGAPASRVLEINKEIELLRDIYKLVTFIE